MGVLRCFSIALVVSTAHAVPDCSAGTGSAKAIAAGHDMENKVAFFTGSDTGVGYETALALAGQGATIIIANHNASKGQAAVENITRITGNKKVEVFELDLASFDSCRKVAAAVLSKYKVLDLVIMDSGVSLPRGLTKDGFEYVMQVNYLGHFLLQQLFLPALRASPGGKLIEVSSGLSYMPCTQGMPSNCTDLDMIANIAKSETKMSNYGLTKLMMVYNARELARREVAAGSKVRAYAIRPGLVETPLQQRTMPKIMQDVLCSFPTCANGWRGLRCDACPMSPSAGAVSPTYLAVTDIPADQDGDFYWQCQVAPPPEWADADTKQAKLYDMALKWTGTSASAALAFV